MTRMQKIVLGAFVSISCFVVCQTKLLECVSESLNGIRYILVWRGNNFTYGDIVFIKGHSVRHVKVTHFAKRVLGFPGDPITHNSSSLQISSYRLPLLRQTQDEKPLTPLSLPQVPFGHVFVAGDHLRSFDSRYEEFGLVPVEKIWGRGILSW